MPKGGKILKIKKFGVYTLWALGILAFVWLAARLMPSTSSEYSTSNTRGSIGAGEPSTASSMQKTAPAYVEGSASEGSSDQALGEIMPPSERKVVKSDALTLLVSKAETSAEQIISIAAELGGFVDGMDIYEVSDTSKSGIVTIRVPAGKLDEAVKKIKTLAIKVEREEISAADITAQYVDLEARLKSLRAEEAQYLKILNQAKTVEDILKVTENLNWARSNIESLQAQIKYLSSQVEMSSITVSLEEEADVQVLGIRWRPLFTVKQGVRSMLEGLSGYADTVISFILVLPVLALWVVTAVAAFWVIRKIYRFVRAKFFAK